MKKKLALYLAVALVAVMFVVPASAASVPSDAQVEFESGGIGFEDGAVTAPPTLNFGKHKIGSAPTFSHTINAASAGAPAVGLVLDQGKVDGTLLVNDLRGVGNGWKLNLKLDTFKNGGTPVYAGANIDFNAPTWTKADPANASVAPTGAPANVTAAGPAVQIAEAANGAGNLIWKAETAPAVTSIEATLNIPTALSVGAVAADLTWSLVVAP